MPDPQSEDTRLGSAILKLGALAIVMTIVAAAGIGALIAHL